MPAPTVYIENVYLAYNNKPLFKNLSLKLESGKLTCLLGPSGVGKTTLLRLIANLVTDNTQFHGDIHCDNTLPTQQQISYMAQTDLLMPWLTALDNALVSFRLKGKITKENILKAKELLIKVGLKDALNKYPHELSGGMRQRVALVRTLLQNKPIVLMDEPFSGLDAITRFQIQALTAELLKNYTVLLITHDPIEAVRLADEIYILSGHPAVLSPPMRLITPKPRDPGDPEFIANQANLFHSLTQAKESSL